MQVACVVNQWAKTSPFRDGCGGLSFMTEAAITRSLNQWLLDEKEVVKKVLNNMYTDQLHCGLRHGVQKSSHSGTATRWNIAFDLEQRGGLQSNQFEREVRKHVFRWLDPGTDKDVRAVVEVLTPAKSSGPKPASIVQVAFAIGGSCASAPDVAALLNVARLVVCGAQQRQGTHFLRVGWARVGWIFFSRAPHRSLSRPVRLGDRCSKHRSTRVEIVCCVYGVRL